LALWKDAHKAWLDASQDWDGHNHQDDLAAASVIRKAMEDLAMSSAAKTREAAAHVIAHLYLPSLPHEAREKLMRAVEQIQIDSVVGIWRL